MNKITELKLKGQSLQRRVAKLTDSDGKWITVRGRHIQIGKGESVADALGRSLKSGPGDNSKTDLSDFNYTKNKFGQIDKAPPGYREDRHHPSAAYFGSPGEKAGAGKSEAHRTLRENGFQKAGKSKLGDELWRNPKTGYVAVSQPEKGGGHSVDVFRPSGTKAARPSFGERLGENAGRRETRAGKND